MTLVRIVKDWEWPDLLRQSPGGRGEWQGVQFTTEAVAECDYLVMLNNRMRHEVRVCCPPANIWMLVQEPYQPGVTDWIVEGHRSFAKVFTHHPPLPAAKYVVSQPAIPWHVNRTYDELAAAPAPRKERLLSWVVGNARELPGHWGRLAFLRYLQEHMPEADLFGRAVQPIADKWDGLAPYYFSLAVENNSGPDMWTEKLADCFLAWCVPFYYGCTNLDKYFPTGSYVQLDITRPREACAIIREEAQPDRWQHRLAALQEARELILNKHQLLPFLAERIRHDEAGKRAPRVETVLRPYCRSPRAWLARQLYKARGLCGGGV